MRSIVGLLWVFVIVVAVLVCIVWYLVVAFPGSIVYACVYERRATITDRMIFLERIDPCRPGYVITDAFRRLLKFFGV